MSTDHDSTAMKGNAAARIPFTDLLTLDMVRISVGHPVEKIYHVHRALLCTRDPVFNAGYGPNSNFTEAEQKELKLADQLPQVADIFVQWLYNDIGNLPIITIGGHDLPIIKENSLQAYIHLYNFADSRCIKSLECATLKEIVGFYSRHNFFVLEPTLCLVYEITPPKCQLRVFMSRAWYFHQARRQGITTGQAGDLAKRNVEFGEDLVLAMTGRAAGLWTVPDNGF